MDESRQWWWLRAWWLWWWCVEQKTRMERISHAFVQLESKWRHGRELAIGWSDGAGDMAATRGSSVTVWETRNTIRSFYLGNGISMGVGLGLDCADSWDCGGREKVGKRRKGVKRGKDCRLAPNFSSFLLPSFLPLHAKYRGSTCPIRSHMPRSQMR